MDVGLEFLPSISNIPDVTTAARIADGAARANAACASIRGTSPAVPTTETHWPLSQASS